MAYQGLQNLPIISEDQVAALLDWIPLTDALEAAMIEFSAGRVEQPVRQMVSVPGHDAIIAAMPAVGEAMAVKIVTLYHGNAGTDLPTHQAVILVFNKENGSPLALMDGRLIPEDYAALRPLALNAFENVAAVQFNHRVLAVGTAVAVLALWIWSRRLALAPGARHVIDLVLAMGGAQLGLGIAALILVVPVWLGALHQAGALALLSLVLWAIHRVRPARDGPAP